MFVPLLAFAIALLVGAALPSEAGAVPGTLTVVIEGQGRVTGPGVDGTETCSVFANAGRPLKAIERPGSGYSFTSWLGCRAGTGGAGADCFVDSYAPVVMVHARFRDAQAPAVALAEPVAAGPPRRGVVGLAATASDNAGVARVEFRVRGAAAGSDDAPPFQLGFDTTKVADGPATVEAVALDAAGNPSTQGRGITIDNTPPALAVGGPSSQSFPPGTELMWTLSASDAAGIAGTQCGVVASAAMPSFGACSGGREAHSARIDVPGTYAFFARVTDAAGNVTASRPLEFTIEPAAAGPGPAAVRGAFLPIVRHSFRTVGARTRFRSLSVGNLPAGSRAELSCRGRGCEFRRKRFAAREGKVALLAALRGRSLQAGARLEVRVVGPAGELKLVRFTMRRGKPPRRTVRCAPAGRACP
jgi:Bacterial Ig domain